MARNRGVRQNFNFVKGWNTEASPMTFPENTAQDLDNVILDQDGSIRRRPGVNFHDVDASFADATSGYSTAAIGVFDWLDVAGLGTLSFAVSQFETTLYFHRQSGADTVNQLVDTVDFSSFAINLSKAKKSVVAVSAGLGYLFVVGSFIEPFYIEYDEATDSLTATQIEIEVRDFDGLDDALEISERPTTLSNNHLYNLLNQGWVEEFTLSNPFVEGGNPIERMFTQLGEYPSNSDIMSLGKLTTSGTAEAIGRFDATLMTKLLLGNSPAPKGHFILNAFNKQRGTESGVSVPAETINNRPNAVAFHNGRAFYSGLTKSGRTGEVYFSQQLINIDRAGRCYQEQDPTAEELNALLATDGGVISIPNCGVILAMFESGAGVSVYATNGVWEISGVDGKFSADSFFVRKVSDVGCIGRETVVNADGVFMYWSDSGIIALSPDKVTGHLTAENLSKGTIQSGYLSIAGPRRAGARGTFLKEEKKAVWLYSTDTSYDGINDRFKFNGLLFLDTRIGAFYKYSVSDLNAGAAPYVAGIINTTPYVSTTVDEVVTENGVAVTENGVDVTVSVEAFGAEVQITSSMLLCVRETFGQGGLFTGLTFGDFNSRSFTDWYFSNTAGVGYTSFLETGFDHGGQPLFDKKPTYVFSYLSRNSKTTSLPEIPEVQVCTKAETLPIDSFTTGAMSADTEFAVSPDGTKVITCGTTVLREYTLSTPFDASTASLTATVNMVTEYGVTSSFDGCEMNSEGTRVVIADQPNGILRTIVLTVPWDITSHDTALSTTRTMSSLTGGPTDVPIQGAVFNNTGTKMVCIGALWTLQGYDCSTPWDVSTAVSDGNSFSVGSLISFGSMQISPLGDYILITSASLENVKEYALSTALDVSTASLTATETFDVTWGFTGIASERSSRVIYNNDGSVVGYAVCHNSGSSISITSVSC